MSGVSGAGFNPAQTISPTPSAASRNRFSELAGRALALNARFLYFALELHKGVRSDLPMRTFRFSITYLMLLFAALIVDHYVLIKA